MRDESVILGQVKQFILKKYPLSEITGIILVGSYATGRSRKYSDIDIIIFKKDQLFPPVRQEIRFEGYDLDIWLYGQDYFIETYQKKATTPNHLGEISCFLGFLREAVIWYQEGSFLETLIASAQSWKWAPQYQELLEFPIKIPKQNWANNAFKEHLKLLELAKNCFRKGRPISHRLKDYPELFVDFKEKVAQHLMEMTVEVYSELGIKREWTEYKDAKKAIKYKDWSLAVASLKDVLKFLIRHVLDSPPPQLLDPMIWYFAEEGNLPPRLKTALEYIYNY